MSRTGFRLRRSLGQAAEHSQPGAGWWVRLDPLPGAGWKAIVKTYLSPEHCDHAEWECPLAALGSELARADKAMKTRIFGELAKYRSRMLPFMPGRRTVDKERAFFAIFSTMIGAMELARVLPEPEMRAKVLQSARDLLLSSF